MNRWCGICLLALLGTALWGQGIPSPLVKLSADMIDLPACRAYVDGKPSDAPRREQVLGVLGVQGADAWATGTREQGANRQFLIVFKTPVTVGAVLTQGNAAVRYLTPDAALPADPLTAAWTGVDFPGAQAGGRLGTLPPRTAVSALLVTLSRFWGEWDRLQMLRLYTPRLHNLVPDALANADGEFIRHNPLGPPTLFLAANITRGAGSWQNGGVDENGQVSHGIISPTFPAWFVLSWDTPQELQALRLQSNFRAFTVLAYQGPAGVNPAVGGEADWAPVPCTMRTEGSSRWIVFRPTRTRGIKFRVTATSDVRYGRIDSLHAYTDLGDNPVPVRQVTETKPPCTFTYTLPADGYISAAIDDGQGRRVRNLTAREFHKAGPVTLGWDLKTETGQMVPTGTYRWKLLFSPGLKATYQMTPYPNVSSVAPENSPWLNGAGGPGGWLADHSPPKGVAVAGDRVFVSAPCSESGVSLIECDTAGKKRWGYGNIIAWTGPAYMTSDGKALYAAPFADGGITKGTDYVWRFTLPEKKLDTLLKRDATATRKRGICGMATRDGKLYLAINAGMNYLENAASPADVDSEQCLPRYAPPPKTNKYDDPDPRADFLRAFRLTGTPPGCNGLTYLESTKEPRLRQHIVLTFTRPVPLGSLAFPLPDDPKLQVRLSVLKTDGELLPRRDSQWTEIFKGKGPGWTVAAAPPNTRTRALRISFDRGQTDVEDEGLDPRLEDPEAPEDENALTGPLWQAKLEGMKLLRRRFANLFSTCKVTVSSGTVSPTGAWDAARTTPLTTADPAIYTMTWATPQRLRGLAIKEIDGRFTEIDAWVGGGAPDLHTATGWEKLATYEQALRDHYHPDQNHNSTARYLDGYVDFGRDVTTTALRLRVVEQWMWKGSERPEGVRRDRGGQTLDPTRCRIYGVAPLQYLGEESPVDPLATERLEVYDTATAKLEGEFSLPRAGALVNAPTGLYAITGGGVAAVDPATGKLSPIPLDVKQPWALTCDKVGNLYVFDGAADQRVVKVCTPAGKALRTIGTPGGRKAGPWNVNQFSPRGLIDMAVDAKEQLWIVEHDYNPKRVSIWGTDGTFKKDLLGNTGYGGGGCLDPNDKTRLFYGPLQFSLDWATGASKLVGMTWLGDSPAGEMPLRVNGRHYLVTRPHFTRQAVAVVYQEVHGTVKRMAAVGCAGSFAPLRTPDVLGKLGKTPVGDCTFLWTDRNDDGKPQAGEVEFFNDGKRPEAPGRFEATLAIDAGGDYRYDVTGFTLAGAPLYQRVAKPANGSWLKLGTGNGFGLDFAPNRVIDPAGKTVWTYPSEGWGVHALYGTANPFTPRQVVAEFDVIGHETAHAGDLGEFLVTNTNTGVWHIWTADGLLAGPIFRDQRSSGAQPWTMREHGHGLDLTNVTIGQEHFFGYFCRTADNKYYAVAGHNHVSVVEVEGIDKFVRGQGNLNVTAPMIQQAVAWNQAQLSRQLYTQAKLITCRPAQGVEVDGNPREWETPSAALDENVRFGMAYDDTTLYVAFMVDNNGPLKNTGNDWKRLFKTGAAVDLQIGANANAKVDRTSPVVGDARLLMTMVNGKPTAVLYQPNAPGAKPGDGWATHTSVFSTAFDRVVQCPEVQMALGDTKGGYCLEAAIPLKTLGLTLRHDLALKMDWGILVSGPNGSEVLQRRYWANPLTAIVSDETAEAMLYPNLWGTVRFSDTRGQDENPETKIDEAL
jgi:hypothetical protein